MKLQLNWRSSRALLGPLVLSLPFLALSYHATQSFFLSNSHAHLLEKAMLALDRGRFELVGFVYPPLPFAVLLALPNIWFATALSAFAGGLIAWMLWTKSLAELAFPRCVKIAMLLTFMLAPGTLYLATQSVAEILSLLLFVAAWLHYLKFTRSGETRSGFIAGLILGKGFFVSPLAAVYGVIYALCIPLFARDKKPGVMAAGAVVLAFPVLAAFGSWLYMNWIFTGDALRFIHDPASSLFVHSRPDAAEFPTGWSLSWRASARELMLTPMFVAAAALIGWRRPIRAVALIVPLAVTTLLRTMGLVFPEYLAVGTYSVVALAGLPRTLPRRLWPVFLIACALQLTAAYSMPMRGEMRAYFRMILDGKPQPRDLEEIKVASQLRRMPRNSVLVDDRVAYRIVARAATVKPFVLPADSAYNLAELRPADHVEQVLVPSKPLSVIGRVAGMYARQRPDGFSEGLAWPSWRLLRNVAQPMGQEHAFGRLVLRGEVRIAAAARRGVREPSPDKNPGDARVVQFPQPQIENRGL